MYLTVSDCGAGVGKSTLCCYLFTMLWSEESQKKVRSSQKGRGVLCTWAPAFSPRQPLTPTRALSFSRGGKGERGEGKSPRWCAGLAGQRAGAHVHPPLPFWMLLTFFWLASDHNIVNFCRKSAFRPLCYKEVAFYHEGPKKSEEIRKKNRKRRDLNKHMLQIYLEGPKKSDESQKKSQKRNKTLFAFSPEGPKKSEESQKKSQKR